MRRDRLVLVVRTRRFSRMHGWYLCDVAELPVAWTIGSLLVVLLLIRVIL